MQPQPLDRTKSAEGRKQILRVLPGLLLLLFASSAFCQDARSMALGGCGTGLDWGPAALIWNPAALQFSSPKNGWNFTTSATAFDSTNTGGAALDYDLTAALSSTCNPIKKSHSYKGLIGLQYQCAGGGLLYDQGYDLQASQSALSFMSDRDKSSLNGTYDLQYSQVEERIDTLAFGYAQNLPLGQVSAALGSTLKLHQGTRFRQDLINGSFTKGSDGGYDYEHWEASSGTGFSWDTGLLVKPSTNIQAGLYLGNINSSFKWKTQHEDIHLDPNTGAATSSDFDAQKITMNRPRITRIGITFQNQEHTSFLTGESVHKDGKTRWSFGFERLLPAQHLALRVGTYQDETSDRRLWGLGLGYLAKTFETDLSLVSRQFPVVQDSEGFGMGFTFSVAL